jgi:hypothetical protein
MQAAGAESQFPFLFASDTALSVGGVLAPPSASRHDADNRNLFIVGPDGRSRNARRRS